MRVLLDILAVVCIGLLVGVEFAVSAFINPILHRLGSNEELRVIRLFATKLGKVMPFWYAFSLVLLIAEAIFRHRTSGEVLIVVAIVIWAAIILLTILILVPINNRLVRLKPNADADAALKEHGRWDSLHRWRVVSIVAAMVCFLVAIIGPA